jgi:hypothetical protein
VDLALDHLEQTVEAVVAIAVPVDSALVQIAPAVAIVVLVVSVSVTALVVAPLVVIASPLLVVLERESIRLAATEPREDIKLFINIFLSE